MGNSNLLTYLIVQGFATNPGGDVQAKALSMLVFFAILFHLSLKVVKTSLLGMSTSRTIISAKLTPCPVAKNNFCVWREQFSSVPKLL